MKPAPHGIRGKGAGSERTAPAAAPAPPAARMDWKERMPCPSIFWPSFVIPKERGVAFGQALIGTASPLPLLPMERHPQWEQLLKLIGEWQPEACLVGLPLNMDDSESELSRRARKFARRLRHQTNLPVWMVDERLSTRDARERSNTNRPDEAR